jgi:hypothetical protein
MSPERFVKDVFGLYMGLVAEREVMSEPFSGGLTGKKSENSSSYLPGPGA